MLTLGPSFTERTTYTGIYNISDLGFDMSFRVQCSENYYGPNCTTFCKPMEGVYTCDSVGNISCVHNSRNLATNCSECLELKRDPASNCTQCLPGRDIKSNCILCLPGRDIKSNCTLCLTGRDIASDCTHCLPGRDIKSNCTECLPGFEFTGSNCTRKHIGQLICGWCTC